MIATSGMNYFTTCVFLKLLYTFFCKTSIVLLPCRSFFNETILWRNFAACSSQSYFTQWKYAIEPSTWSSTSLYIFCKVFFSSSSVWNGGVNQPFFAIRLSVAVRILRISGWFRQSFLGLALWCLRGFFPGRRWFLKICSYGSSYRKNFLFQNRLPEIQR